MFLKNIKIKKTSAATPASDLSRSRRHVPAGGTAAAGPDNPGYGYGRAVNVAVATST